MFWGNDELALIYESEWKSRRSVVSTFAPGKPQDGLQILFDRYSSQPSTLPLALCILLTSVLDLRQAYNISQIFTALSVEVHQNALQHNMFQFWRLLEHI